MGYYKDLRELVAALDERGLLYRIKRQINKDTELMPLVRWQFRGLPEAERKAFLFENVVDATGLQCAKEEIYEKLVQGPRNLIPPVMAR